MTWSAGGKVTSMALVPPGPGTTEASGPADAGASPLIRGEAPVCHTTAAEKPGE
ncbi:hypothetical protein D3C85_1160580 [compost metagenome]